MLSTKLSVTSMLTMLVFFSTPASSGSFFPVSGSDRSSLSALRGVPMELRDKILAFHRQLDAPDNFSIRSNAKVAAGLAEWTKEDDVVGKEDKDEVRGELQTDLFMFSREVAIQAEKRVRGRDRKEWERLLKSRKVSRRLNKQLRKRFGHHKIKEEWSEEEIVAFRKMKRKLKKRIARRLRVKELEERRLYL